MISAWENGIQVQTMYSAARLRDNNNTPFQKITVLSGNIVDVVGQVDRANVLLWLRIVVHFCSNVLSRRAGM